MYIYYTYSVFLYSGGTDRSIYYLPQKSAGTPPAPSSSKTTALEAPN